MTVSLISEKQSTTSKQTVIVEEFKEFLDAENQRRT